MGGGTWTKKNLDAYAAARGFFMKADGKLDLDSKSTQEVYRNVCMDPSLKITGDTKRECRDTAEHPETVPVILALDVTGSMGMAAREVASALNKIMMDLYESVKDVEFMIMAIGDFAHDVAPVQVSQFESDIRIAESLDKVWFEGNGGPNPYESYTGAWWVGVNNTELDCWKRGKTGLIITIGDEPCNPIIPKDKLEGFLGVTVQGDVETGCLRKELEGKYEATHIHVNHGDASRARENHVRQSFGKYGVGVRVTDVDGISEVIVDLVKKHAGLPASIADSFGNGETGEKETADTETIVGDITW